MNLQILPESHQLGHRGLSFPKNKFVFCHFWSLLRNYRLCISPSSEEVNLLSYALTCRLKIKERIKSFVFRKKLGGSKPERNYLESRIEKCSNPLSVEYCIQIYEILLHEKILIVPFQIPLPNLANCMNNKKLFFSLSQLAFWF